MSANSGSEPSDRNSVRTPDQWDLGSISAHSTGSVSSKCSGSQGLYRSLLWTTEYAVVRLDERFDKLQLDETEGGSTPGSVGKEMSAVDPEVLHRRQADLLADPKILKALRLEACNRVMDLPEVQNLVEEQVRLLAGNPEVVRKVEASKAGDGLGGSGAGDGSGGSGSGEGSGGTGSGTTSDADLQAQGIWKWQLGPDKHCRHCKRK